MFNHVQNVYVTIAYSMREILCLWTLSNRKNKLSVEQDPWDHNFIFVLPLLFQLGSTTGYLDLYHEHLAIHFYNYNKKKNILKTLNLSLLHTMFSVPSFFFFLKKASLKKSYEIKPPLWQGHNPMKTNDAISDCLLLTMTHLSENCTL